MSLLNQKTIKNKVSFSGIGLHSGERVQICIKPSEPNTGIVFKRIDLKEKNLIYPSYMNVINSALCTTIINNYGVKVSTIEHLMGALFGLGIDNALIEIDNEEVPILDKVLPNKVSCKSLSLDLSFICVPNYILNNFEKVLNKFQISVYRTISYQYLHSFLKISSNNLELVAQKILTGFNENEVILMKKKPKNLGFFEKFFNFFN